MYLGGIVTDSGLGDGDMLIALQLVTFFHRADTTFSGADLAFGQGFREPKIKISMS